MISGQCDADDYPCIIDIREFSNQSLGVSSAKAGTDYLTSRHYVDLPEGPVKLGIIALGASANRIDAMPRDEFILVMEGELEITGAADFLLGVGEAAVLPKNSSFSWSTPAGTVLVFLSQESDESEIREPVKVDPSLPREPSPPMREGLVIGELPKAFRHIDFESRSGLFAAAAWNSNGYARHPIIFEYFELMYLLEGTVSFVDRRRKNHEFGEGDIFVVRKGGQVNWVSTVPVSKIAAICRA